jgi:dUTP pyrophosphatase
MKFEVISKYIDAGLNLPARKTKVSAGYDFQVAEDTLIPSYFKLVDKIMNATHETCHTTGSFALSEMARLTKDFRAKPTLVPTGIKCEMPEDMYLELSVRSSCPLKHWLILANGVGIIDADYYNNPDNEGHIFFQIINLSPFDIMLKKGDAIGQGIFKKYYLADDDAATAERQGGFGSTDNIIGTINNIGLPNTQPVDYIQMAIDLFENKTTSINEDTPKEECAMACNPERRAFVFETPKDTITTGMSSHYE